MAPVRYLRTCASILLIQFVLYTAFGYVLVARHAAHGPLDAGFGSAGIVTFRPDGGEARATAIGRQSSGRIIVGGWSTPSGSFKTHAVLLGLRP